MYAFDYEDIQLIPSMCVVKSRNECNTEVKLGKHTFKMPVMPANMASVINEQLCEMLAKNGYFYVMHRFNVDSYAFVKKMLKANLIASISVGVKQEDYDLIEKLAKDNIIPDYITIDIAHGHSISVKNMIEHIRKHMKKSTFIIAGNVGTPYAVRDLEFWGADATKVGVGPGKVCITKLKTGFGTGGWQLGAIKWCSKAAHKPIIADGGLRVNGDIAKSIRFGATMCMIGSLFAAHEESPGANVTVEGELFKEYYGSASEYNKGEKRYVEGKKELIKVRGKLMETYKEMQEDLQSSISYSGGTKLNDIKKVDYVILKTSNF
ncbi:GMP reductase [Spiroplasma endosymbiont of Cantharis nigra]|uniref:GMP reductase n=1 Tax=Spiroplasma endosymbiont of Cantharis nigra TaxID=3066278 RepID=UPI0030D61530